MTGYKADTCSKKARDILVENRDADWRACVESASKSLRLVFIEAQGGWRHRIIISATKRRGPCGDICRHCPRVEEREGTRQSERAAVHRKDLWVAKRPAVVGCAKAKSSGGGDKLTCKVMTACRNPFGMSALTLCIPSPYSLAISAAPPPSE